jgi:hypothetical protein
VTGFAGCSTNFTFILHHVLAVIEYNCEIVHRARIATAITGKTNAPPERDRCHLSRSDICTRRVQTYARTLIGGTLIEVQRLLLIRTP